MSKHYFGADLFSRTHLLSEIFVQIFAHFDFLRENARKLVRAKISTNKVSLSKFTVQPSGGEKLTLGTLGTLSKPQFYDVATNLRRQRYHYMAPLAS